MGEIAFYKKGPFGSSITKSMFIPKSENAIKVYEQKNAIQKNANLGEYYISSEKFEELKNFEVFPNDIIVSCAGTIGETYVMPNNIEKGIINQALMRIKLYDSSILDFYLMYFNFILKNEAKEHGKGTAIKNIPPFDVLKEFLIPLPSIQEQKRIMDFLQKIDKLIQNIENDKKVLSQFIKQTKSKVLDLAIRGKLVPQNPNDEPASVLLERIKKEHKPKKSTTDISHYPFEIPENWMWCNFSKLYTLLSGRDLEKGEFNNKGAGIPYVIGASNINGSNLEIIRWTEYPKVISLKNDLLITCKGTVGELLINQYNEIHIARQLMAIRAISEVDIQFSYYCISFFINNIKENAKGIIPGISRENILNLYIPLPPIAEQHRIVSKIEQIFTQLDEIESSIREV